MRRGHANGCGLPPFCAEWQRGCRTTDSRTISAARMIRNEDAPTVVV
jgi:hypothetical protein